jgi:fimbrial chaperone protein
MRGLVIAAAAFGWSTPGQATSLRVTPLLVEFAPGQSSATVDLENLATAPVALQLRAQAWEQDGPKETFTPTNDLVISPPVVTLPASETQTVRLVLRKRNTAVAQAYRLFIDEIPPVSTGKAQVVMALSISMPVFTIPANNGMPKFKWRIERTPDGKLVAVVSNSGGAYGVIRTVTADMPGRPAEAATLQEMLPYVLPGGDRRWILPGPVPPAGSALRLKFVTPTETSEVVLTVAP